MEGFEMKPIYIVIKNMSVININLSSSYLSVDLSQNAYLGFAHNLARTLAANIPEKKSLGKIIKNAELGKEQVFSIIKHLEFYSGHTSYVGHLNDNNHQKLNIPMNPPEIKGTIKQTLVIKLFISDNDENIKKKAKQFLLFNRYSAGDIQHTEKLEIEIIKSNADLEKSLQWERGWVVKDATQSLVEEAKQSDYSTAFCNFISTFKEVKKGKKDKITYKRHHKGWYYASLAGYQLLESPKERKGARFSHSHAFAEPIIGLHKLEYFRAKESQSLFWLAELKNNVYCLKQGN